MGRAQSRDYGRLLVSVGEVERGRELLHEARTLAVDLGMEALKASADRDLAALRSGVATQSPESG